MFSRLPDFQILDIWLIPKICCWNDKKLNTHKYTNTACQTLSFCMKPSKHMLFRLWNTFWEPEIDFFLRIEIFRIYQKNEVSWKVGISSFTTSKVKYQTRRWVNHKLQTHIWCLTDPLFIPNFRYWWFVTTRFSKKWILMAGGKPSTWLPPGDS